MSLINKLLNDLESRQSCLQDNQDVILDGLYSAYDIEISEDNSSNKRAIYYIIFGFVILTAFLFHSFYTSDILAVFENPGNHSVEKSIKILPAKRKENIVHQNKPEEIVPQIIDLSAYSLRVDDSLEIPAGNPGEEILKIDEPSSIRNIDFNFAGDAVILSFILPEKIDYRTYTLESPNRLVVEIHGVNYEGNLPDIKLLPDIVNIRKQIDQDNNFNLVLESRNPISIKESGYLKIEDNYELQITLTNQENTNIPSVAVNVDAVQEQEPETEKSTAENYPGETIKQGDLVKTLNEPPEISRTDKLVIEGLDLYGKGQVAEGLDLLYTAVNEDEVNSKARVTLALKLIEQGQKDLAIDMLEDGLKKYPEHTDWSKLLARIYIDNKNFISSEEVLARTMPSISEDPEYHALYAATLQNLSKHEQAALTYRNLVQVQPNNGIWWMGLAISLEAISRKKDAMFAYRNALNGQLLTPDTQRFILERIRYLDSQIKNESS